MQSVEMVRLKDVWIAFLRSGVDLTDLLRSADLASRCGVIHLTVEPSHVTCSECEQEQRTFSIDCPLCVKVNKMYPRRKPIYQHIPFFALPLELQV